MLNNCSSWATTTFYSQTMSGVLSGSIFVCRANERDDQLLDSIKKLVVVLTSCYLVGANDELESSSMCSELQHLLSEWSENGSEELTSLTSSALLRGVFPGMEDMTQVVRQLKQFKLEKGQCKDWIEKNCGGDV